MILSRPAALIVVVLLCAATMASPDRAAEPLSSSQPAAARADEQQAIQEDERAFLACANPSRDGGYVEFEHAPTAAAMRHLARLKGPLAIHLDWPKEELAPPKAVVESMSFDNIETLFAGAPVDADALIARLVRRGGAPKPLKELSFSFTSVTDAGLANLANPDGGLAGLAKLEVSVARRVTAEGWKQLARPGGGLAGLRALELVGDAIDGAKMRALSRSDNGLTHLTTLVVSGDGANDEAIEVLTRPDTGLPSIRTLDLTLNHHIGDAAMRALARANKG